MNYIEIVKKMYREVHDALPRQTLSRLAKSLDRAGDMQPLLDGDDPLLEACTSEQLIALSAAHKSFTRWKEAATALRRELAMSKLNLPDGSLEFVFNPRQISALGRAARMCPRASFPNHDAWRDAVKAHVDLYVAAVELAVSNSTAQVQLKEPGNPDSEDFAGFVGGSQTIAELIGHRWLGLRRGQRAEFLSVELQLPTSEIADQARARLPQMGLSAQKRGVDSILEELVNADIEAAVFAAADERSENQSINSFRGAYLNLLEADPLEGAPILSLFSSNAKAVGVAVLNQEGHLDSHHQLQNDTDFLDHLRELADSEQIGAVVLPLTTEHADLWRQIEQGLGDLPVAHCLVFGLSEAKEGVHSDKNVAAATVLGQRMLSPRTEWAKVDPLRLGLGEYPRELEPDLLKSAVEEVRTLARWQDRRQQRSSGRPGGPQLSPFGAAAPRTRLNPMVKSISDLKPGMTVSGIITNLTRFGAFVNIGLATEAMIHVSQLSTEFVDDPAKVVRVGQNVEARVIEVIPEKKRIGLSMKPAEDSRRDDDTRRTRNSPQSKHSALADLDALFKK